MDHLKEGYHL